VIVIPTVRATFIGTTQVVPEPVHGPLHVMVIPIVTVAVKTTSTVSAKVAVQGRLNGVVLMAHVRPAGNDVTVPRPLPPCARVKSDVQPSSTCPSQLLSTRSPHTSVAGSCCPKQSPYAVPCALHVLNPARHEPTFSVPAGPV
jgi:hypothetical protein